MGQDGTPNSFHSFQIGFLLSIGVPYPVCRVGAFSGSPPLIAEIMPFQAPSHIRMEIGPTAMEFHVISQNHGSTNASLSRV